jgi:hypothetical protein
MDNIDNIVDAALAWEFKLPPEKPFRSFATNMYVEHQDEMMNWENKKADPFEVYWARNKKYIIDRYREKRLTKA